MKLNEIVHGTQYYRAPTPLPSEWEGDIKNFESLNIDAFQIRINWRWNEVREGEYKFDDVDKLFDLAEKHGRRVIVKLLLECAPQYVFDKLDGAVIGPRGEKIRGGSHGAFYGGWRPCFTNPKVQAAAARFTEEVAKRYKDRHSLILWNAWNEIRNRPIEDCFCPHCRKGFGKYLEKKFGSIDALNDFYKTAEDSFDTIALPAMPHGFWDMFEFKKYKGSANLHEYLAFVYDAIKKHDKVHPVMSHVGFSAAFQDNIGDVCDDFTVSRAVDFFGTSIPCECNMDTEEKRLNFMLLNDYVRSVDKDYFIHEVYPGLGMFKDEYDTPYDMKFKLYTALSSGAKGLVYWQYRAERIGMENDCAGIMRADGSPREVASAVADFGADLKKNMKYFIDAHPKKSDIAIVFDFNSMLLSEIEDSCGPLYEFKHHNPIYYYKKSHSGMYRLLRRNNYSVDYIHSSETEKYKDYKVLYFPYYNMFDPAITESLAEFVKNGGTVIADEGFGLREMNTWMQPYDIECKPLLTARMRERRMRDGKVIDSNGNAIHTTPFVTEFSVENASTLVKFESGAPAIQSVPYGKGKTLLLSFPLGYSAYDADNGEFDTLISELLKDLGIKRFEHSDFKSGLYEKRVANDKYESVFIFNCTDKTVTIAAEGKTVSVGGDAKDDGDKISVASGDMGYYVLMK